MKTDAQKAKETEIETPKETEAETIHIKISPELQELLLDLIDSGMYSTYAEICRSGIRKVIRENQDVIMELRLGTERYYRLKAGLEPGVQRRGYHGCVNMEEALQKYGEGK